MQKVVHGGYIVHSDGRVYSPFGKLLKQQVNHSGYLRVCIGTTNRDQKKYSVHRLVAAAFIPNPENYCSVNHKDGNKSNNNVNNLEWCSVSQNNLHRFRVLKKTGKKLTWEDARRIRLDKPSKSYKQLAEEYGVSKSAVKDIIAGRTWKE